jgi:hypothetical protein
MTNENLKGSNTPGAAGVACTELLGGLVCTPNQIVQKRKHLLSAEVRMAFGPLTKLIVKRLVIVEWLTLYNACLCQSAVALPGGLELRGGNIIGHITTGRSDSADRGLIRPDKIVATSLGLQVNGFKLSLHGLDVAPECALAGSSLSSRREKITENSASKAATAHRDRDSDDIHWWDVAIIAIVSTASGFFGAWLTYAVPNLLARWRSAQRKSSVSAVPGCTGVSKVRAGGGGMADTLLLN